MSTCNWLDLQTLGSQLAMPKILLGHWSSNLEKVGWLPAIGGVTCDNQ